MGNAPAAESEDALKERAKLLYVAWKKKGQGKGAAAASPALQDGEEGRGRPLHRLRPMPSADLPKSEGQTSEGREATENDKQGKGRGDAGSKGDVHEELAPKNKRSREKGGVEVDEENGSGQNKKKKENKEEVEVEENGSSQKKKKKENEEEVEVEENGSSQKKKKKENKEEVEVEENGSGQKKKKEKKKETKKPVEEVEEEEGHQKKKKTIKEDGGQDPEQKKKKKTRQVEAEVEENNQKKKTGKQVEVEGDGNSKKKKRKVEEVGEEEEPAEVRRKLKSEVLKERAFVQLTLYDMPAVQFHPRRYPQPTVMFFVKKKRQQKLTKMWAIHVKKRLAKEEEPEDKRTDPAGVAPSR